MRKLLLILLFLISPVLAQDVNNPQTNASALTTGTIPNARLGTSAGSWTPTDASGASLSLTVVGASWTQIGNMVFVYASITYPSTANGSNALLGGLPVNIPNQEYARQCSVTNASVAGGLDVVPNVNSSQLSPRTLAGANVTNATLSTQNIKLMCIYPAS